MAGIAIRREDMFPVGTSVAAYLLTVAGVPASGAPAGSALETETVQAGGTVTFDALAGGSSYILYAGSPDRYLRVRAEAGEAVVSVASPSGVAASDTAAIQAALTAASLAGGIVQLLAGTYSISATLTMPSNVSLRGAGRSVTILRAATNLNAPLVKTTGFDALTLSGNNTGGVWTFSIRDLTFDGNASNQSTATTAGVAIYGVDFELANVAIRNVKAADALYTEWGALGGAGLPEKTMKSVFRDMLIHDNTLTGAAWRYRGPHDSMASDIEIHSNSGATGLWTETQGTVVTVAAGSNGVAVSTFAGAGTLNVNTTLGYPDAGQFTVPTSGVTATITYTGKTAQTFTGCTTTAGTGTLSTGAVVVPNGGGYAGSALLVDRMHIWGGHTIAAVLDASTKLVNCELEGAATGQVLIRGGSCSITGGRVFYLPGTSNPGYGIQLGDSVNTATGTVLTDVDMTGFQGGSAALAAINFVATASGKYSAQIFHSPATMAIFGTVQAYERRQIGFGSTTTPTVASGAGLGSSPPTTTLSNAADHRGRVLMGTGTSPTTGSAATVTFRQQRPGTPIVIVSPGNAGTAALQPYVINASSTAFTIGFAVAPAASQAASTYDVAYSVDG